MNEKEEIFSKLIIGNGISSCDSILMRAIVDNIQPEEIKFEENKLPIISVKFFDKNKRYPSSNNIDRYGLLYEVVRGGIHSNRTLLVDSLLSAISGKHNPYKELSDEDFNDYTKKVFSILDSYIQYNRKLEHSNDSNE